MRIALIGYMGSGKTSISKQLSRETSLPLFDLDREIEKEEGATISHIIKAKGELYFRKLEREVLQQALHGEDAIISTGGGTPCYYDNMDQLNQHAETVYLQLSVPQLYERLEGEQRHRPLIAHLEKDELKDFIGKHLLERSSFYEKAKFKVRPAGQSVTQTVEDILSQIS